MKKLILIIIVLIFATLFYFSAVFADDVSTSENSNLPITLNFQGVPGKTNEGSFFVSNLSDKNLDMTTSILDFEVVGENGDVQFTDSSDRAHAISSWIHVNDGESTIKSGENKEVKFTIDVPVDAVTGGHWAMIEVKSSDENGTVVNLLNALVTVTVGEDGVLSLTIKSFSADLLSDKKSADLILKISNNSENFIKPKGKIIITDIWGFNVGDVDFNSTNLFPNTTALIVTKWKPANGLPAGLYKIKYNGIFGPKNITIKSSRYIWIMPWQSPPSSWLKYLWILFVVVVVIILLQIKKLRENSVRRMG